MVYYVVSDESLTHEDLINVLCEMNYLHPENGNVPSATFVIPIENLTQNTGWSPEEEYYVQMMERNYEEDPYEYLVMTITEVRQILKLQADAKCSSSVLRKLQMAE